MTRFTQPLHIVFSTTYAVFAGEFSDLSPENMSYSLEKINFSAENMRYSREKMEFSAENTRYSWEKMKFSVEKINFSREKMGLSAEKLKFSLSGARKVSLRSSTVGGQWTFLS